MIIESTEDVVYKGKLWFPPSRCLGTPHSSPGKSRNGSTADVEWEMNVAFVTSASVEIWKFARSCLAV